MSCRNKFGLFKGAAVNTDSIIDDLGLEKHIEGGYYRRTFCSDLKVAAGSRQAMASSIFYLLTQDNPVGHFHKNKSDILHFYHGEGVIRYHLITDRGEYTQVEMGRDLKQGQQLQLLVERNTWKASELVTGNFGLISEVVIPEFRFEDMTLATLDQLKPWKDEIENLSRLIR